MWGRCHSSTGLAVAPGGDRAAGSGAGHGQVDGQVLHKPCRHLSSFPGVRVSASPSSLSEPRHYSSCGSGDLWSNLRGGHRRPSGLAAKPALSQFTSFLNRISCLSPRGTHCTLTNPIRTVRIFLFFILEKRESALSGGKWQREGERKSEAGCTPREKPDVGLELTIPRLT